MNNSTFTSSNNWSTPIVHVVLNLISLMATIVGTFVSFVMLTGVLLRRKTLRNARLLLSTNNYLTVFVLGIVELMDFVNVIQGDFGISVIDDETIGCRIRGYIIFSLLSAIYLAYVLQVSYK